MTSSRAGLVADAALELLARGGTRGLTHRAVDAETGLAPGSTSYYYRTRGALLAACVGRLAERDHEELDAFTPPAGTDALAEVLGATMLRWLTTDRWRHLARYELSLESVRRPELAGELHRSGQALRERVEVVLAQAGAADPARQARWLVACIDGILFDNIAGANAGRAVDPADVRAATRGLVAVAVGATAT